MSSVNGSPIAIAKMVIAPALYRNECTAMITVDGTAVMVGVIATAIMTAMTTAVTATMITVAIVINAIMMTTTIKV